MSNPISRLAVWAFGLDTYRDRTNSGTVDQSDKISGRTASSSYSWIPWQRDNTDNTPTKNFSTANVLDTQEGWGISGYFSPGRDRAVVENKNAGGDQTSSAPLGAAKAVAEGAAQLPEKLFDNAKGLFSSALDRANDFLTPHLEVAQPFQSLKVDEPSPTIAPSSSLEVRKLPDKYIDAVSDTPFWRWMIPNNLIADTIVNFSDSVKDTFWNTASQSPFAISTEEATEKIVLADSNESSAFSFVYDGITKTSASMSKSFLEGTSTVSDSLVALVASPPWDTYYKGAAPFFENSSITATMGGIGGDIFKGIMSAGVAIGVRKENVVSLVMEQDISEQAISTEEYKDEEFSPTTYHSNSDFIHSAEDASTVLNVLSLPPKSSNIVFRFGGQMKDAVVFTVSGATKNVFPVTSFLYRKISAQFSKPITSAVKEDRGGLSISVVDSSQPALDDNPDGRKKVRYTRLQGALSATMRAMPILRVIPPLYRWSARAESLVSTESDAAVKLTEAQGEKDAPFVHVHVGDSERFYDLWKDSKESGSLGAKGAKPGETSFPFDEEALTTVSVSTRAVEGAPRGVIGSLNKDKGRASVAGERIVGEQALKEEKALQAYDPSMVPSGGSKVPFPMMIGGDMSSSTIDFIQQLRSPFFQNSNTDSSAKERVVEERKTIDTSEFARPVPVPTIPTPATTSKSALPQAGVATLNSTFPFAFPFDTFRSASLRGFGGLSLPPATVRDISEISLTDTEEDRRQRDSYSRSIAGAGSASAENDEVAEKLGSRRAQEMKNTPSFVDIDRVPFPTKADLSLILSRRVAIAVTAALSCQTLADAKEYQREIGLKSLISAITESLSNEPQAMSLSLRGIKGICRLIRIDNSVAVKIVDDPEVVSALCNAMEAPLKVNNPDPSSLTGTTYLSNRPSVLLHSIV